MQMAEAFLFAFLQYHLTLSIWVDLKSKKGKRKCLLNISEKLVRDKVEHGKDNETGETARAS